MGKIIYSEECYRIQGAVFEVYRQMGCGFLEEVYQECLEKKFSLCGIPFESQKKLTLYYKERPLDKTYIPDFICYEKIIVELKALRNLSNEHHAQVLNYLKATGYKIGLLVNFGVYPKATVDRLVL